MAKNNTQMPANRSLWNRVVPVRIRHNIRIIFSSIVVLALVGVLLGSFQIRPIVFSDTAMLPYITNNIEGTVDLFDHNVPHSISLEVSNIAYNQMISDFVRFNEKTMVEADAIIDGTFIGSVGIRLKGNSTLGAIRREATEENDPPPPEADGGEGTTQNTPTGNSSNTAATSSTTGEPTPELEVAANSTTESDTEDEDTPPPDPLRLRMRAMMGGVTSKDPSTLPLLLSIDEYFPGRGYQGRTELSIRPVAGGGASLNEALSLQLIADSDQVSQQYTWTTFSLNGSETRTRLILENPNQNYVSNLDIGRGVLFKSKNSNAFEYHGDDPVLYVEDFLQLNAIGSHDLSPVIRFLSWLDSATDEEFDTELPQRLDTASFAKYVVTQDLLDNFDDMAGPGRNFLFWYDLDDEIFTVVNWDMNLAMIGVGAVFDDRLPGRGDPAEDSAEEAEAEPEDSSTSDSATADSASENTEAEGSEEAPAARPGPNGRPLRFGNTLKDRFVASEIYSTQIEKTRAELFELWFASGRAIELVDTLSAYVPTTDHLSNEQINDQIAELKEQINSTQ